MARDEVRIEDVRSHMALELDLADRYAKRRWGAVLLSMLEQARAQDPGRYDDEWVGYLAGFRDRWRDPFVTVRSTEQLEWLATLLPCARFGFDATVSKRAYNEPPERWLTAEAMRHVNRLWVTGASADDLVQRIADATHIERIEHLTLNAPKLDAAAHTLATHETFAHMRTLRINVLGSALDAYNVVLSSANMAHLEILHPWDAEEHGDGLAHVITESEHLRNLTGLNLGRAGLTRDAAIALANSPNCAHIETLDLQSSSIGPEGMRALAESEHLTRVRSLYLQGNNVRDEGVVALAGSPNFANLVYLDLDHNIVKDEGAIALANSEHLSNLEGLRLQNNRIGFEGFKALTHSRTLTREASSSFKWGMAKKLKKQGILDAFEAMGLTDAAGMSSRAMKFALGDAVKTPSAWLAGGILVDERLEKKKLKAFVENLEAAHARDPQTYQDVWLPYIEGAFGAAWHGPSQKFYAQTIKEVDLIAKCGPLFPDAYFTLDLTNAKLTDAKLDAIVASGALANVRVLDLSGCHISAGAVARLVSSEDLGRLQALKLGGVPLGEEGLAALCATTTLGRLHTIELWECGLDDEDVTTLLDAPFMGHLTHLYVNSNQIGDVGALSIASASSVYGLEQLNIEDNAVGDAGAIALVASANLGALTSLALSRNAWGKGTFDAIAHMPQVDRLRFLRMGYNRLDDEAYEAWARSWYGQGVDGVYPHDDALLAQLAERVGIDMGGSTSFLESTIKEAFPRLAW